MEKQPSSRFCFLCGRQNPVGLKITWYSDHSQRQVRATVTVPEHFNGYPGVVHGGIVAAILDDALPNHITLFDLAVDPPALWDEQRERVGL